MIITFEAVRRNPQLTLPGYHTEAIDNYWYLIIIFNVKRRHTAALVLLGHGGGYLAVVFSWNPIIHILLQSAFIKVTMVTQCWFNIICQQKYRDTEIQRYRDPQKCNVSSARFTSVKFQKGVVGSDIETPGPIERTPGTPGSGNDF